MHRTHRSPHALSRSETAKSSRYNSSTMKSTDQLTMEAGYRKPKVPTIYKVLAVVAVLMTIATIVLAVLYGLNVGGSDGKSETVTTTPPPKPTTTTASPDKTTASPDSTTPSSDTQAEICESAQCISAASRILTAMNSSVDPCDDFFQYACGNWIQDQIIAADQSSVSTFNGLRDDVSATLKRVLEEPSTGDRESIKKAKDFYALCMDTAAIDALGVEPVRQLIVQANGWPVLGDPLPDPFKFEDVLGFFRSTFSTYSIMGSWVSADDMNSSVNILQTDQPSLGMPGRDYYIQASNDKAKQAYRKFMVDFMNAVAPNDSFAADIETVADEIIAFETEIAMAMAPSDQRRDSFAIYNKFTVVEMSTNVTDTIEWMAYFNKVLSVAGKSVTGDSQVVTYAPEYMKNVTAIINGRDTLVQNYLVWRILKDRISYMSADLRATYAPYREAVSGTSAEEARWKTCSDTANSYFPMPVGSLFVQEAFPEENKEVTVQMVEDIRTVFKEMLPSNEWMDAQTKVAAEEKADLIKPFIAYPDYIVDESDPKLDNEYQDSVVMAGKYLGTVQGLIEVDEKKGLERIDLPVDFDEWITAPAIVNAFYSSSRNQIVFPAGILQPPFYDAGQPNSMNYGGIGMVIGHEITHGFDDSGSQFDGYGNLNNWWTNTSRVNFDEKAQCMIDQYTALEWEEAGGLNVNGQLTLGENIADNGGIRETYMAYKKWQASNPLGDLRLPGLSDFTQDQLLFIGYAQVWCSKYTEAYARQLLLTDPHSPGEFRVVVPSQNFEEFANAFGCKKGEDVMAPDHTCRVW